MNINKDSDDHIDDDQQQICNTEQLEIMQNVFPLWQRARETIISS